MGVRQRLLYLALQQHYFSGVACALGLGLLSLYFFAGIAPADVPVVATLAWIAPLVVVRQVIASGCSGSARHRTPTAACCLPVATRRSSSWPIYLLAAVGVFRQRRLVFKVTPKGAGQADRTPWAMLLPHASVGLVTSACLASVWFTRRLSIPMIFWASMNAILMLTFVALVATRRSRGKPPVAVSRRRPSRRAARSSSASPVLVNAYVVDDHLLRPSGAR